VPFYKKKMEMQQMIERLLAGQEKAEANRKAMQEKADAERTHQEQMLKTMQENADANRKADREQMLADRTKDQEQILAEIRADRKTFKEKIDTLIANIKIDWKETTACQEVTGANPKKIEPNPGEKETALEQQEIPNEVVEVHSLKEIRSETAPSQKTTETKPDPGTKQSVEEHQEIPKEDAAVMPFRGLKK
jgi:hypothetical protein